MIIMKIKIITDSASDILQEDGKKLGIDILPLKTIFSDEEFLDGVTITHEGFYKKLIETNEYPKTSQISPYDYEECFKKYKDCEVIVITLSKKLSGCYQSAMIAKEEFDNVSVVDSENVAIGEQILVKYAIELANKGLSKDVIVNELNKCKKNIKVIALLDTLEYLKKGGRINAATAFVGTMLSIKPVVSVKDGKVVLVGKARGSKNGNNMLRKLIGEYGGVDFNMPFVSAYTGLSDAMLIKYLEDSQDLYNFDMNDIPISTIGSTIGTHVGPGAIAVAFFSKNKNIEA